eukprot:TRINITY_DN11594_c0_g1_i2.p1 TRINITY_DN11594_c0_g1~~TRINITY_DN11594_c0_g1_i2.p1  ORF type:complete len:659 (+),score=140.31 TRINITY_DN11594_c0_g1_i2:89-1978(+)
MSGRRTRSSKRGAANDDGAPHEKRPARSSTRRSSRRSTMTPAAQSHPHDEEDATDDTKTMEEMVLQNLQRRNLQSNFEEAAMEEDDDDDEEWVANSAAAAKSRSRKKGLFQSDGDKSKRTSRRRNSFASPAASPRRQLQRPVALNDIQRRLGSRLDKCVQNQDFLQWGMYEFFYSPVDKYIFKDSDAFTQALRQTVPNLAEMETMRRFEWQAVKRRLGKPRRFSPRFIAQQRELLHQQRQAVQEAMTGQAGPAPVLQAALVQFCVGDRVVVNFDQERLEDMNISALDMMPAAGTAHGGGLDQSPSEHALRSVRRPRASTGRRTAGSKMSKNTASPLPQMPKLPPAPPMATSTSPPVTMADVITVDDRSCRRLLESALQPRRGVKISTLETFNATVQTAGAIAHNCARQLSLPPRSIALTTPRDSAFRGNSQQTSSDIFAMSSATRLCQAQHYALNLLDRYLSERHLARASGKSLTVLRRLDSNIEWITSVAEELAAIIDDLVPALGEQSRRSPSKSSPSSKAAAELVRPDAMMAQALTEAERLVATMTASMQMQTDADLSSLLKPMVASFSVLKAGFDGRLGPHDAIALQQACSREMAGIVEIQEGQMACIDDELRLIHSLAHHPKLLK